MRGGIYIELFGWERAGTNASGICFDDADGFDDTLRGNAKSSTDSTNGSRRGCDVWIRPEIDVKHDCIGALTEDTFVGEKGTLHERDCINNIIAQFLSISLFQSDYTVYSQIVPCSEQVQRQHHIQSLRIVCVDLQPIL